jgi:hypothetical protein
LRRIELDNPTTNRPIILVVVIKSFVEIVYDLPASFLVLIIFLRLIEASTAPPASRGRYLNTSGFLLAVLDAARVGAGLRAHWLLSARLPSVAFRRRRRLAIRSDRSRCGLPRPSRVLGYDLRCARNWHSCPAAPQFFFRRELVEYGSLLGRIAAGGRSRLAVCKTLERQAKLVGGGKQRHICCIRRCSLLARSL